MNLPSHNYLPVNLLAACFKNTATAYKFYWFLSVLQAIEEGNTKINKQRVFVGMVSNAWYTINYFHISFGKQDKLQRGIEQIRELENLNIDEKRPTIEKTLLSSRNKNTKAELKYFNSQVPHWFLSPWFPGYGRPEIYEASKTFQNQCIYSLHEDQIIINPEWIPYLKNNSGMLKDFCYWNLALYLQNRNPNVPDIPNKLIKPATRGSLINQRKGFWDIVVSELGSVKCIYTGEKLTVNNYAVEHFIPFAFVSHDLIWNLIPADKSFNCTKSDKLPQLDTYFDPFFDLQSQAIDIIQFKSAKNRFLEDYLTIFPDLKLPQEALKQRFKDQIQPLITIASNNGFLFMA